MSASQRWFGRGGTVGNRTPSRPVHSQSFNCLIKHKMVIILKTGKNGDEKIYVDKCKDISTSGSQNL
jgi:hypothetical protein